MTGVERRLAKYCCCRHRSRLRRPAQEVTDDTSEEEETDCGGASVSHVHYPDPTPLSSRTSLTSNGAATSRRTLSPREANIVEIASHPVRLTAEIDTVVDFFNSMRLLRRHIGQ
jgi:hypothetical protein